MKFSVEQLSFRFATAQDAKLYHSWANDEDVRRNAHHSELIPWEKHEAWFNARINSDSIMLVFFYGHIPIGQIRADREHDFVVVDFSVDKGYRGRSVGSCMLITLVELVRKIRGINLLEGTVKADNTPSAKAFERSGFKLVNSKEVKGVLCNDFRFYFNHK